jgi:hypothetical protein
MPKKPERVKRLFSNEMLQSFFDEYVLTSRVHWKTPEERKNTYFKHRDYIINEYIYANKAWPLLGCRPDCFWSYEHPDHAHLAFGNWRDNRHKSFEFLKANNLLMPGEEENFKRQNREISVILAAKDPESD